MIEAAVAAARLAQFACAVILCGAPLVFLYALPARGAGAAVEQPWPRTLLRWTTGLLLLGVVVGLVFQTAAMAGSIRQALDPASLIAVLTGGPFGWAIIARFALALQAFVALAGLRPSRVLWAILAATGAGVAASFAWTGHGAADEGLPRLVHLVADVLHLLAAGVWLGALAVFALLLLRNNASDAELQGLHRALARFAGAGSAAVAILLATGLVNSWFLVGPAHLAGLVQTPYGLLLLAKVALFAAMLALATANRFRLTPGLGAALAGRAPVTQAVAALRRSVLLETTAAFAVLAVVSVLGTLAPPSSSNLG